MVEPLSWAATVRFVHQRAGNCCIYCFTCQRVIGQPMHIDHIIPNAGDLPNNLALACASCNLSKNDATHALDPQTEQIVSLFNPRVQQWTDHFAWIDGGCRMLGLTPTGRATIERLGINQDRIVNARLLWVQAGVHPPS
jgi:hypothetical protein